MESLKFLLTASFYPPFHLGGDAIHVRYLAEALSREGHEVHVEYPPAALKLKRARPAEAAPSAEGIHPHPIRSLAGRWQPLAAYAFGAPRGIRRHHERLVRETGPDVIHYHNLSLLGLGLIEVPTMALKVYTEHGFWLVCPRQDLFKYGRRPCESPTCLTCSLVSRKPPQVWRYRRDAFRALRSLDAAIAPSRFVQRAVQGALPCPISHIPNFAPDRNPSGSVRDPDDYYLFVGRFELQKGIRELAKAIRAYRGPHRFLIIGKGKERRFLRDVQEEQPKRVDVRDWMPAERLGSFYSAARALLMPSVVYENSPLAAIEALSWGVPIACSERGGLPELLYDGTCGLSFPPSPPGIVEGLERFEAGDLPHRLRKSARLAYEDFHTPSRYLGRYTEVLERAWEKRGSPLHGPSSPTLERGETTNRQALQGQ